MLETASLNKSYKMVVLWVFLDRDALWDGLVFRGVGNHSVDSLPKS